jgi:hypothetical protein
VRQDDHGAVLVEPDPFEDLVRPADEQLVGARDPLARGQGRSGIGDHGPPAEPARERAKRLGYVDGAQDDELRRWAEDLDEDLPPLVLDEAGPRAVRQLRRSVAHHLAADDERLRAERLPLHDRQQHCPLLALDREAQTVIESHSSRSRKTSISPPHGRPTSKACSSGMP